MGLNEQTGSSFYRQTVNLVSNPAPALFVDDSQARCNTTRQSDYSRLAGIKFGNQQRVRLGRRSNMLLPMNINQRISPRPTQSGNRGLVKYQIRNLELAKQFRQQVKPTGQR